MNLPLDHIKSNGVHYTPPDLASFLAAVIVEQLTIKDKLVVLDPACGDGALLLAIARALPPAARRHLTLVGYETDRSALALARETLSAAGVRELELHDVDFLSLDGLGKLSDTKQISLFNRLASPALDRYDAVIANPPYVRTQVMGSEKSQLLSQRFGLTGRVDLYHAFTMAIANVLKDGGVLGLLTSNRFLTVRSGASIRSLLRSKFQLEAIYDLGDTKLFSAAVLPVIVVARRTPKPSPNEPIFDRVYESRIIKSQPVETNTHPTVLDALRDRTIKGDVFTSSGPFRIERGFLPPGHEDDVWALSNEDYKSWLHTVRRHQAVSFGDIASVRVGIKTTADDVFIRNDWGDLPSDVHPEPQLLFPLVTHHDAKRWIRPNSASTTLVLYPHTVQNGRRCAVSLDRYPKTNAYLNLYRERLTRRRYVTEAGREWYEIWVPQDPEDWNKPKLVYPDISEFPRFFLDNTGAIVNGDCYWITLNGNMESSWLLLMLAVANSSFITTYYDVVFHNKLYSGRRRFMTQYVRTFPLPSLKSGAAIEVIAAVKEILHKGNPDDSTEEGIDALVWKSFGFLKKHRW